MLRLQTILLLYLLMGVYVRKRNIVTVEARSSFNEFLIRITLPCMIFSAFHRDFGLEQLAAASKMLLISFGVYLFSSLLGGGIYRCIPFERRSVMRYGTLVSNAGFAGLPQVQGAYGPLGLFYGSIFLIPLRIFMWSAGISLFVEADWKTKMKNVLTNPGMIAVFLGLPRMLLQIPLPAAMDTVIQTVGDCTTPLSMIVIGMVVADIPIKTVVNKDTLFLSAIRLIVLPVSLLIILKLLHVDPILAGVSVMLTAMPVGVNTPIIAQKYGGDHVFASKCVLLSTALSLITIPLLSIFL